MTFILDFCWNCRTSNNFMFSSNILKDRSKSSQSLIVVFMKDNQRLDPKKNFVKSKF